MPRGGDIGALVEQAGFGLADVDASTGCYLWVSDRFCEIVGYDREQLVGRTPALVTHPDDLAVGTAALDRVREGSLERYTGEKRYVRRDGRVVWVRLTVARGQGEDAGTMHGIVEDVTDRHATNAALAESEARMRALVDQAADAMFVHDADGVIVDVNRRACESLGYTREELLRLNVVDVETDFDLASAKRAWAGASAGDSVLRGRQRRKDGSILPVEVRLGTFDIDGRRLLLGLVRDLTAQVTAEEEARKGEERLATLLRDSLSGTVVVRLRDGAILEVNEAFTAMLGWTREEVRGKTTAEIGLYADPWMRERAYEELDRTGVVSRSEVHVRHRSGQVRECINRAWLVEVRGERCVVGLFDDVTALRRADALLRKSENDLRALFETTPIGLAETDPSRARFVRVNEAFCRLTGYTAEELRTISITDLTHPDDRPLTEEALARYARDPRTKTHVEKRYIRKDGRVVWVEVNACAIRDVGGKPMGVISTVEDVTVRRATEAVLRLQTTALQAAANAIAISDADGRVRWINQAFSRLTGYPPDEVLGRGMDLLRSGAQDDAFYAKLWRTIRDGGTWQGELVNRRRDGTLYPELETITPVRDPHGVVTHFVSIKQDITEQKRHEEALVREEERLRLALEAAELGTWRRAAASEVVELDERARRHFGLGAGVVTIDDMLALVHPDDLANVRAVLARASDPDGSGRVAVDHRITTRSGEERWLSTHVRAHVTGPRGQRAPAFLVATTQDITEAKRSHQALRTSEDRYRGLVDNLEVVVFSFDLEGRLTFINRAIERYGYKAEEICGRPVMGFIAPDDLGGLTAQLASLAGGEASSPFEVRGVDAAGKVRLFESRTRAVFSGGKVVGFTGLATDVTRQRETAEQLRAAQRMEAVGRLAGGVAHDFNNLLSVILSYVELALDDLPEEERALRSDLGEISAAARRAEALTRQLLAFSRRQVLEPETVDAAELVNGLSNMLTRLIGEDVSLRIAASTPVFATRVDRGQIEQVVMNLVVNARDAMPDGGELRIDCRNATIEGERTEALDLPPGDYVELVVSDDGCGMTPETAAKIFEPFFTTKPVGKGTGLGLSTVHGIVRQSGGGISVDTAPGRGSTFHVFLPRHRGPPSSPKLRPQAGPSRRPAGIRERILVVEDEAALRAVIERMLRAEGYDVVTAATPADALASCEAATVDLLLTDVVMPGMNGRELARRIAVLRPRTRVLFMSGYTDETIEHHGVLGANFLRKPFDTKVLASRVRSALDGG